MQTCHTPYPESQSLIFALPESSLKHVLYSTFLDTISHSDVTDFVVLPMQQPSPQALGYVLPDIHCLLIFGIQPKDVAQSAPFSASPLTSLQALILIACSIIDTMADVSPGVKFRSSHIFCYSHISLFSSLPF